MLVGLFCCVGGSLLPYGEDEWVVFGVLVGLFCSVVGLFCRISGSLLPYQWVSFAVQWVSFAVLLV